IFEQMGAFIAFRRCMYVGECADYRDKPVLETINSHFKMRIKRIPKTEFPEKFHKLVDYQYKWLIEMAHALDINENWATNIGTQMYNHGKEHKTTLEDSIRNLETVSTEDEKYKQETLDYIDGKKFNFFENLAKP
ncbi:MAG: hypothetical protein KJ613_04585, partial [Nanoarchaeota archaeon]|nr:hypothetical protein [Nanoarchaeota archaeon]